MYIRLASTKDSDDILRWRNDPITRKMSIDSSKISQTTHNNWYKKSLKSKNCSIYIAEDGKRKLACAGLTIMTKVKHLPFQLM